MKRGSIFDGVVRFEDSYTNLLRNLMLQDSSYCIALCQLLCPQPGSEWTVPLEIRTQVPLATSRGSSHGRADLLIESNSAVLLVEVKTDLYCSLTELQDFGLDESGNPKLNGYLKYLEYRKQRGDSVGLCLLAPRSWKYRAETERQFGKLRTIIPAQLRTWEELCRLTVDGEFGSLVHEFGHFLGSDFMSISFGETEASLLTSDLGLEASGSAYLKLHELIKQAAKELRIKLNSGSEIRFEVKDFWGDATELGATVYRGDKRVLWFGTWTKAKWPLIFGYDENWTTDEDSLDVTGFSSVPNSTHKWKTFKLPKECFTGNEPLINLVTSLLHALRIIHDAS
jgi:hypothetical protein